MFSDKCADILERCSFFFFTILDVAPCTCSISLQLNCENQGILYSITLVPFFLYICSFFIKEKEKDISKSKVTPTSHVRSTGIDQLLRLIFELTACVASPSKQFLSVFL